MSARWWFPAEPVARIAVLRAVIYPFVVLDMFLFVNDVIPKADAPGLYAPIVIPRFLHLPAPNPVLVHTLQVLLIAGCAIAATGRLPRLAGWTVAACYQWWIFIGMSYGKVDHDHLALLVALWVLPTLGRVRWDSARRSEAAGWALRCIQVAVVLTYFLAAFAKIRHGGWDWANGAVFTWSIERRGSMLADPLVNLPWLLVAGQWMLLVAEFTSPVVFALRGRAQAVYIGGWMVFHVVTYAAIGIHFLPTVVCWLAFAPLEKLAGRVRARSLLGRQRAGWGAAGQPVPVVGDQSVQPVRD